MRASLIILGLVAIVAVVVAVFGSGMFETEKSVAPQTVRNETSPPPAASSEAAKPVTRQSTSKAADETTASTTTPAPVEEPEQKTESDAGVVRVVPADGANAEKTEEGGAKPPSFDVVRVNPQGDAVIAGRAQPGAEVTVKDAGDVVGKATADKRGEFVLVPDKPLPSGARQLSLEEKTTAGEEKSSKDVVVLFVPEKKPSGEQGEAVAVLTPREGQGGSKVLQAPEPKADQSETAPQGEKDLSLKVIDYDEEGRVVLSGKAPPGSEVRAVVDDNTVGSATADDSGDWQISPQKPVVSGQHAIRIEQVSKGGVVLAKLNVPFSRAVVRPGTLAPGTVVVEPGNSLWRIARNTYGSGMKYTLIFAANAEQIGDPDMIFPGQIFVLPPDSASN